MAMIVIGRQGPRESLPLKLRNSEYPADRKPLGEIVMEGIFRHNE
jgi:hypothetical protein